MPYVIKPHWDGDGLVVEGVAGEALSKYDLVYLKGAKWYKADLDTEATMPGRGMALSDLPINYKGRVLLYGLVKNPAWAWVDGPIYASSTAGGLTQTAPTGSGWVQSVGDAHGSDFMLFAPTWIKELGVTKVEHEHLSTGLLGKKNLGPPDIVIQDNTKMLAFTVDTDDFFYSWEVPLDYAGGGLGVVIHWTNDGGADDNGKNVKFQLNYQTFGENSDSIAGSHANSPKTVSDAYTSDVGWVSHTSPTMTIVDGNFADKHEITFRGRFITADATVLTCEPHLISVGLTYLAYVDT